MKTPNQYLRSWQGVMLLLVVTTSGSAYAQEAVAPPADTASVGVEDPFHHVLQVGGESWVVLRVDVDDIPTEGPTRVRERREDGSVLTTRVRAGAIDERGLLGAAGAWTLHDHRGTTCRARLSRVHLMQRRAHLPSEQTAIGGEARVGHEQRLLVARAEGSARCATRAAWASQRAVDVYRRGELTDASLQQRLLTEVRRTSAWRTTESRHREASPNAPTTWESGVEFAVWESTLGRRRLITYDGSRHGSTCEDLSASLTFVFQWHDDGTLSMLSDPASTTSLAIVGVADLDGDGAPELVLEDGAARLHRSTLAASHALALRDYVCPC